MSHINDLQEKMSVLNHKFKTYKEEEIYHAGWLHAEKAVESAKMEYLEALNNLVAASLPHENNAIAVGDLIIYSPVGLDDIDALLKASSIPCQHSNNN